MPVSGRLAVLVAASGASWEARALHQLSTGTPAAVLLKRCVDLSDLLATASTGQAQVALVAPGLPGLDAESVAVLGRAGVAVVVVAEPADLERGGEARIGRLGIEHVVESGSISQLSDAVAAAGGDAPPVEAAAGGDAADRLEGPHPSARAAGRTLAVWGPTGAPGRTTVAVGLAAELAHRGHATLLVDVDGYGGAVAQHLGVLDEMSGLLGAARLANAGRLDQDRLVALARQLNPALRVLTGLPRADRWTEVRDSGFAHVLELAAGMGGQVVLDTGFSLEQDANAPFGGASPQRNAMTLAGLEHADEVVVVGSADPVGLARLARGLVELLETVPGPTLRLVVNRTRASLGWGEHEMRGMIEGFVTPASVHFLPDDRAATDRALASGKSLVELGDSPLRRGLAGLADAVTGEVAMGPRRRLLRRRRAGRAR